MLRLRKPATEKDARELLEWRNDPLARKSAVNSEPIPWLEHWGWFLGKTGDPAALFFMASDGGTDVGACRVDISGTNGEVDLLVAPSFRGKGYGKGILAALAAYCRKSTALKTLFAKIKQWNAASKAVFLANGFVASGQVEAGGQTLDYYVLQLRGGLK